MDTPQFIALVTFALVSTITPGPNNIMLMTSSAKVGITRTVPHILGIIFGFSLMILLVGFGLTEIFDRFPIIHSGLQIGCIGYLFYLATKIALSKPEANDPQHYQPISFWGAANFQWLNPKAWSIALSAISVYNISDTHQGLILITLVFAVINVPSAGLWVLAGKKFQSSLNSPTRVKYFNYSMASLLLTSILMMVP